MIRAFLALLGLLIAHTAVAAVTLPTTVTTRIGRGQIFAEAAQPKQAGVIDWLWSSGDPNNNNNCLANPAGVSTGLYWTGDRLWAHAPYSTSITLSWLRANHPDWIVYLADQQTPAWEFGDSRGILPPTAIWNPSYQNFLVQTLAYPLKFCNSFSVDNVQVENVWGRDGTCSISFTSGNCTSNGGTFTSRYGGAFTTATAPLTVGETNLPVTSSAAFTAMGCAAATCYVFIPNAATGGLPGPTQTFISTISAIPDGTHVTISPGIGAAVASGTPVSVELQSKPQIATDFDSEFTAVKTAYPKVALWANLVYTDSLKTQLNAAIAHADGVLSEAGVINNCAYVTTGSTLVSMLQWFAGLTQAVDLNAYLSAGCYASTSAAAPSWQARMTMLAAYLMIKRASGDHTYLSESINDATALQMNWFPETFLTTGAASGPMTASGSVYYRDYPDLIAVLNPSGLSPNTYTIPATLGTSYHTPDNCGGTLASGEAIQLGPMQGVILLPGAPVAGKCGAAAPR